MGSEKQTQSSQLRAPHVRALLQWYQAAGVDICVSGAPIDQFALSKKPKKPSPLPRQIVQTGDTRPPAKIIAQQGVDVKQGDPAQAQKAAMAAKNLVELRAALETLEGCALRVRATQLVFDHGNADAEIMLIGKAPSRDDDLIGHAFSGKGGELLDNMLGAIGLDRGQVYLANIVPWRPPGNRDPAPHEIDMCLPFLKRQIELVAPRIIVTLGELAAKSLLEQSKPLASLRGGWTKTQINSHQTQILASLHPEFLLKQPAQKALAWSDLQKLQRAIKKAEGHN